MRTKTIKEQIRCPRCKGKGRVFDAAECVFTAGIAFVLGAIEPNLKRICPRCDGDGWIYRIVKITEEDNG